MLRTERLTPHLVRVVLGGPGLAGLTDNGYTDRYVKLVFPRPGVTYPEPLDVGEVRATMPREQWLRFMVERLEAARPLLIDDAVIAIQCSFHQSAHLEVTLDGLDWLHKVMVFHVLVRHPGRALTADKQFNDVMEQILIYSPDPHFRMPRRERERDLSDYRWEVEIHGPGTPRLLGDRWCHVYAPEEWRKVEVTPGEAGFHVEIWDNGQAVPATQAEGEGLSNLRKKLEREGGLFQIQWGRGVRLILELPAAPDREEDPV